MQSDQFDNKLKEAADHHHPPYDEKAWEKMEKLLDKHLPQKKDDRKRYIFFLLLFLLTGGGLYLIIDKPWQSDKHIVSDQKNIQNIPVNSIKPVDNSNDGNAEKINNKHRIDITKSPIVDERFKQESDKQQNVFLPNKNSPIKKIKRQFAKKSFSLRENESIVNPVKSNEAIAKNNKANVSGNTTINGEVDNIVKAEDEKTKVNNGIDSQKLKPDAKADSSEKKSNSSIPFVKKAKSKNRKGNSFFVSVSAGPDLSFTGLDELGKVKLLTGAGIGYSFKNKFTLRTGFYSARKVYWAQPYQYHAGSQWVGNYKLERVDADCKVYEIPLLLSYHFGQSAKQNWFATAGLSSYLMKEEIYDYQYKTSSGQSYTYQRTLKDKNKHFFSVLTLSGGYQHKINNTFSIMAEPYMKIPLSGVGYGKVKLNSAGVLISIGVKLFGSDKNNK